MGRLRYSWRHGPNNRHLMRLSPGARLGSYEVVATLGAGGMDARRRGSDGSWLSALATPLLDQRSELRPNSDPIP